MTNSLFISKRNYVIIALIGVVLFSGITCYGEEAKSKKKFVYDDKGMRDPFYPVVSPEGNLLVNLQPATEMSDINLEGIIYDSSGASFAIINGSVLKEFDQIGGFKIIKIEKNEVSLEKNHQIHKIGLKKEE